MFIKKRPVTRSGLDDAIDRLLREMEDWSGNDEEYGTLVSRLSKLHEMRMKENPDRISKDTLAIVAGNLAGIVLIVGHERAHVVTSKALNFVMKLR